MIHHLIGRLVEKSPTHAVIECAGVGYFVNITLNTFSTMGDEELCKLLIHQVIREDAHVLFGFAEETERQVFRKLISVSGVGASTGRMILSSMSSDEVKHAILSGDVTSIKAVKGIGAKTAQRIIVDLQDKISNEDFDPEKISVSNNTLKEEALSALSSLGFERTKAQKTLDSILKKQGEDKSVEELIKLALKQL